MDEKTTKYLEGMNELHEHYLEHGAENGELEYVLVEHNEKTAELAREMCRIMGLDHTEFTGVWVEEEEYIDLIGLWDHDLKGLTWQPEQGFFIQAIGDGDDISF